MRSKNFNTIGLLMEEKIGVLFSIVLRVQDSWVSGKMN